MDGFKNCTKTQYMKGGDVSCYAKGGAVKGAAKISKVMGEFKAGKLHSGSESGPKVTSPKQAKAIAMSEARTVMKKAEGGAVARGNRVSAEEAGESKVMRSRRPSMAEPDYSRMKNYDAPGSKQKPSELTVRLTKRGPAGMRHDDTPLLDRVVGAVRDTLGFQKGGLAAMPKGKKC